MVKNKSEEILDILEMSNIGPKTHKFGINVKLNLLQPGDARSKHGPRVKVFKENPKINFSIKLGDQENSVELASNAGDYREVVSTSELNILVSKIKKYRKAFLKFWYTSGMDQDELRSLMDDIDSGKEI